MDISKSDVARDSVGILEALSKGENLRLSRQVEAEMGRRSTYYLAKSICGYADLNNTFHIDLCNFYDRFIYSNQLHLHPRKHFKTTLLTVVGKIRLALLQPNIAICIDANTVTNAQSFVREIKSHFLHNDKFQDLYPEHVPQNKREEGSADAFTTPARTKAWIRMPTFEAAGIDRAIVSRHYDLIHFDDVVDKNNTNTKELMQKVYDSYVTSLAVTSLNAARQPWHHIVGTRWHMGDMYANILESASLNHFKIFRTSARWKELVDGQWTTKYLFPEKFPPEALEFLEQKMGRTRFACLYLNDPVPEEDAPLDPSYMQTYHPLELGNFPLDRVITVDPATSRDSRKGDPTVISAFGMDPAAHIFLLDCRRGWWSPDEIINQLIDMHQVHGIYRIGIEAVAFSKWLCFYLQKEMDAKCISAEIIPIRRDTSESKTTRQERILTYHRNKMIFYRVDEPLWEVIRREHREWPFGRYDDYLDTLTDAIELLNAPSMFKANEHDFRMPRRQYRSRSKFQTGYSYFS